MLTQRIIKEIELYYSRYSESNSDQMLYYTTKHLIDFLYSYEEVKKILCDLKEEYPFKSKNPEEFETELGFEILKEVGLYKKKYISYVLHYLEHTYSTNNILDFYDDAPWTCYNNSEYDKKERIRLFKIEVIKPICDYVTDALRKNVSLMFVLNKYKIRTMRFDTPYHKNWKEHDVQDKLARYLFDRGYTVHKEEDLSNGRPDFLFYDEDDNPFVIEVKYIKNNVSSSNLWEYTSQLKDYMSKLEYHFGVLCIFTRLDYDFIWHNKPDNMEIQTIYVGERKPSERKTKNISIDLNSSFC